MRYALMDIGTNSTRVMLAKVEGSEILHIEKHLMITRIGQSVDGEKILTKEGMERTIHALQGFTEMARIFGATEIHCFATSAVRDASNQQEFLERVNQEVGIEITILSGDQEAEVGFVGAIKGAEISEENVMVIDIGGGSTEIIVGNQQGIQIKKSFDMGCVRFTERYEEDLDKIAQSTLALLRSEGAMFDAYECRRCIGIAGTITTIAAMELEMEEYDPQRIQGFILTKEMIHKQLDRILSKPMEKRSKIKGLQPKRADIIHTGMIILLTIMEYFGLNKMSVSDSDNLEGSLQKMYLS